MLNFLNIQSLNHDSLKVYFLQKQMRIFQKNFWEKTFEKTNLRLLF